MKRPVYEEDDGSVLINARRIVHFTIAFRFSDVPPVFDAEGVIGCSTPGGAPNHFLLAAKHTFSLVQGRNVHTLHVPENGGFKVTRGEHTW